jgi:hypothetical protein
MSFIVALSASTTWKTWAAVRLHVCHTVIAALEFALVHLLVVRPRPAAKGRQRVAARSALLVLLSRTIITRLYIATSCLFRDCLYAICQRRSAGCIACAVCAGTLHLCRWMPQVGVRVDSSSWLTGFSVSNLCRPARGVREHKKGHVWRMRSKFHDHIRVPGHCRHGTHPTGRYCCVSTSNFMGSSDVLLL